MHSRSGLSRASALTISLVVVIALVGILVSHGISGPTQTGQSATSSGGLSSSALTQSTSGRVLQYDGTVPPAFQSKYQSMKQFLSVFDQQLSAADKGQRHKVTFAAELLTANSNRGTQLLAPNAVQGVMVNLDAFQAMGITGVTIAVGYPLYTQSFPNYSRYVDFYKQVAQQVHQRGLVMDVETGVLFAGTPFSAVQTNYTGLSFEAYISQKKQMVQAIIDDMHPDYLNLGSEPDTEYALLNMPQLLSPDTYATYVAAILDGLDKGSTKVGAGIGAWDPVSFVQKEITIPGLDVITLHVYPLYGGTLQTMVQVGQMAQESGKRIVLDEAWDTKSTTHESSSIASDANIFARDVYGFWSPIDQQFLSVMAKYAQDYPVDYLSPFWSQYFFAYLNYSSDNADLSFVQLSSMVNVAASQHMLTRTLTPTGNFYAQLIQQYK